jgi:hypothetical protein
MACGLPRALLLPPVLPPARPPAHLELELLAPHLRLPLALDAQLHPLALKLVAGLVAVPAHKVAGRVERPAVLKHQAHVVAELVGVAVLAAVELVCGRRRGPGSFGALPVATLAAGERTHALLLLPLAAGVFLLRAAASAAARPFCVCSLLMVPRSMGCLMIW